MEDDPDISDTNPFRYCGEYYDRESKTYYLRARYYAPSIGRFTQQDTHWNTANMIYGDNPQKINEREDKLGLTAYTTVPQITAVMQAGNLYVYGLNNPVVYVNYNGNFILSTAAILITGSAILLGTVGGFIGNHIANKNGAAGWDKVGYIAAGAAIGAVGGGILGAAAAPIVVAATGMSGISITATGISTIAAAGTSFGTMGILLEQSPNIVVNWSTYAEHGLARMVERGITQQMVNCWVKTGKVLQQGIDKFVFITKEGLAIVTSAGKLITAYICDQYDLVVKEIVKKLFGE